MTLDSYKIERLSIISDTKGEYSVAKGAAIDYYEEKLNHKKSTFNILYRQKEGKKRKGKR